MVAAVVPSRFKLEPTTWLMWVPTNHLGKHPLLMTIMTWLRGLTLDKSFANCNQPNQPTSRILQCPGKQALSKSFLCVGNDELYLLLVNTGNTTSHSCKSLVAESMWAPSTLLAPLSGPTFLKDTWLNKFYKLLQCIFDNLAYRISARHISGLLFHNVQMGSSRRTSVSIRSPRD